MSEQSVVIVDGARTPMGGLLGALSEVPAPELASTAISAALARAGAGPDSHELYALLAIVIF